MIIKEFVNSSTAFTWSSSWRLRVFFFQTAKDSFGFVYTSTTSTHVVLLAFLGNAFSHSIVNRHYLSALAASALRHLAFCSAEMQCMVIGTQGCVLNHFLIPMTPCQREVLSNSAYGIFCFPSQHARYHLPWRIQLGQVALSTRSITCSLQHAALPRGWHLDNS